MPKSDKHGAWNNKQLLIVLYKNANFIILITNFCEILYEIYNKVATPQDKKKKKAALW